METEQKNDFLSKIRPIAEQANDLVEEGSGSSLIIIATDRDEVSIVMNGTGEGLTKALVAFALHGDTRDIFFKSFELISEIVEHNYINNN